MRKRTSLGLIRLIGINHLSCNHILTHSSVYSRSKRKMQKLSVQVPSILPSVLAFNINNSDKQVLNVEHPATTEELMQFSRKYNLDRLDEYDFSGM